VFLTTRTPMKAGETPTVPIAQHSSTRKSDTRRGRERAEQVTS
jgi:hypothetical protein